MPGQFYIRAHFLSRDVCRRLCAEMTAAAREPAEVLAAGGVADGGRRAWYADVSPQSVALLEGRLDAERDAIALFHGRRLEGREGPGFACYERGGFYGPHRDRLDVEDWPDVQRRTIAAVVFLNSADTAGEAGDFTGGMLRLFVDTREPVTLVPAQGTLVTFPADVVHEVTPVERGVRFSVVDWFYEPAR